MNEIYCEECNFVGDWKDTLKFPEISLRVLCPECGSADLIEVGGVSDDTYREQNPRERVVE